MKLVSWVYLILAGEIGIVIGFILAVSFSLSQIRRFNKNISYYSSYSSPQNKNSQLYKSPMEIKEIYQPKEDKPFIK